MERPLKSNPLLQDADTLGTYGASDLRSRLQSPHNVSRFSIVRKTPDDPSKDQRPCELVPVTYFRHLLLKSLELSFRGTLHLSSA
ncbi:hypothetical protein NDU88_008648 [Pleurodeles waltl]|uniref:Uncharacterized protein n=1 Tax=Pleurodeles waltl TaxID=8319 RepID=A0AAV7QSC6_PLEWA|nr:hypothetical protein NDU88_008648 [Pleurodeles waltl]